MNSGFLKLILLSPYHSVSTLLSSNLLQWGELSSHVNGNLLKLWVLRSIDGQMRVFQSFLLLRCVVLAVQQFRAVTTELFSSHPTAQPGSLRLHNCSQTMTTSCLFLLQEAWGILWTWLIKGNHLLGICSLVLHILIKHYIDKLYGTANQWHVF